jgi:hypothetical protein
LRESWSAQRTPCPRQRQPSPSDGGARGQHAQHTCNNPAIGLGQCHMLRSILRRKLLPVLHPGRSRSLTCTHASRDWDDRGCTSQDAVPRLPLHARRNREKQLEAAGPWDLRQAAGVQLQSGGNLRQDLHVVLVQPQARRTAAWDAIDHCLTSLWYIQY